MLIQSINKSITNTRRTLLSWGGEWNPSSHSIGPHNFPMMPRADPWIALVYIPFCAITQGVIRSESLFIPRKEWPCHSPVFKDKQNGRGINNKRIYKDVSSSQHLRGRKEGRTALDGGKLIVNFNSITRQEVNTQPQCRAGFQYSLWVRDGLPFFSRMNRHRDVY